MGRVSASEDASVGEGSEEGGGATKVVIFCSLPLSCSRCLSDHERPIFTNLGGAFLRYPRTSCGSFAAGVWHAAEGGRKTHLSS